MMNGVTSAFELSKVNCRGVESLTIYVDCGAGRTGKEFTFRNKIKQQITIYTVFREKKTPMSLAHCGLPEILTEFLYRSSRLRS